MKTIFGEIKKIEDFFTFVSKEKNGEPVHKIREESGYEHYSAGEWWVVKVKCKICGDELKGHPISNQGAYAGLEKINKVMDEHIELHERIGKLESLRKTNED